METVSPAVAKKMIHAGVHNRSFEEASDSCSQLAELDIKARRIGRLTAKIGAERVEQREVEVESWQALGEKRRTLRPVEEPPKTVSVSMDGGRFQVRERTGNDAAEQPPSEDDREKGKFWREMKGGLLMELEPQSFEEDPYPEIPVAFVDPRRMSRLVREIHGGACRDGGSGECDDMLDEIDEEDYQAPKIVQRHVIASAREVSKFGPHLASEAWRLGFMNAERGAFVGDGSETNWGVWRTYFPDFTPVVDFVHAICYVYQAVMQNLPADDGWDLYCRIARTLWSGEPAEVLDSLEGLQHKVGLPGEHESESSPRNQLVAAIRYIGNQQSRMRYPEYRQAGLPITSAHMESTMKQINRRVKGSEKFWSRCGGEAMLQLVADHLTDLPSMELFWQRREHQCTGVRQYR